MEVKHAAVLCGLLLGSSLCFGGPETASEPQTAGNTNDVLALNPATAVAPGLGEIFKMLDAGVSVEVVRTFIQNSPSAVELSASDILMLKRRGVSDDITNALLKRAGELRASSNAPVATAGSPPLRIVPTYHGFDPDSYAYFHYYYLHPRTLAAVNQRLGTYGPGYPYGYPAFGYYGNRWLP